MTTRSGMRPRLDTIITDGARPAFVSPGPRQLLRGAVSSCTTCRVSRFCLPKPLDGEGLERFDALVKRKFPYPKGKILFRQGEPFESIFAVRSGSVKTAVIDRNGNSHVTDFFLPGDLFGLDGIADAKRSVTATALEHLSVCEIPFKRLQVASRDIAGLPTRLLQLAGQQMARKQQLQSVISHSSATQCVVSFLLDLSARLERISLSPREFRLPMTRIDLASHLGLTVETVSRVFASLACRELISFKNREVTLVSMDGMRAVLDQD